jgi:hypothetical protein
MTSKPGVLAWLQQRTEDYCAGKMGLSEVVEDFNDVRKLGYGFASVDELEEIDLGDKDIRKPTFVSAELQGDQRTSICELLREFSDCFAWSYDEMPGLDRELVEHSLPIKRGFRPFKQPPRNYNQKVLGKAKEEVERLLVVGFIKTCWYAEWVSKIVPVEKKNIGKIQVCMDFRNLNRVMPKDEYPMPIAEELINRALGHKMISFRDGNAGYTQIFMVEEDVYKMAFHCPGFVGLFEWVVMTFGLKNTGVTYCHTLV